MIDLSRLDCPVVSIFRRAFGIVKQQADKKEKEDTKGFSTPDATTQFQMPEESVVQRYIKENW